MIFDSINDSNGNYGTLSKIFHFLKTKCSSNINNFVLCKEEVMNLSGFEKVLLKSYNCNTL